MTDDKDQKSTQKLTEDSLFPASWPLEAERVSLDDPLMECLAIVAASHGKRTTAVALSSGLPIHGSQMASPAAFVRAADRIHMTARMVRRPLQDLISSPNLPCILVLKNNQACILRGPGVEKGTADVIFPETPDAPTSIAISDLQSRYGEYAFFVRPRAQLDAGAGLERDAVGADAGEPVVEAVTQRRVLPGSAERILAASATLR